MLGSKLFDIPSYFYLFSVLNYKTEQNKKHNGQLAVIQVTILLRSYTHGHKQHVTQRNHNRNTALERSVIDYWAIYAKGAIRKKGIIR